MSTLSPELEHGIDVIVAERTSGVVNKFLTKRALKKEIKEIEPLIYGEASFSKLGALTAHIGVASDNHEFVELVVKPEFDSTAETLLEDIPENGLPMAKSLGLKATWNAIHAWELSRSDTTQNLASRALNSFYGSGQDILQQAFTNAVKSGETVQDELSKLLGETAEAA